MVKKYQHEVLYDDTLEVFSDNQIASPVSLFISLCGCVVVVVVVVDAVVVVFDVRDFSPLQKGSHFD